MCAHTLAILKRCNISTGLGSWLKIAAGPARSVHTLADLKQGDGSTLEDGTKLTKGTALDSSSTGKTTLSSSPFENTSLSSFRPLYKAIVHQFYSLHNARRQPLAHQARVICTGIFNQDSGGGRYPFFELQSLVTKKRYLQAIELLLTLLEDPDCITKSVPQGVPMFFIPGLLILALRTGETELCLRAYDRVSKLIGVPGSPEHQVHTTTPEEWKFYRNHELTLEFVRHLVCLSERKPSKLKGWSRERFEENPRFFLEAAERVYRPYAILHGFDRFDSGTYELKHQRLESPLTSVAVACLFELGCCEQALGAFSYLFDRWTHEHAYMLEACNQAHADGTNPIVGPYNNLSSPCTSDNVTKDSPLLHLYPLDIIFPSMARRNLDYATQFLLEIAPARDLFFSSGPRLYEAVIQESLKQQKLDEALRVLEHAQSLKDEDFKLGSTVLDNLIHAILKSIRRSWKQEPASSDFHLNSDECKAMASKRLLAFSRIQDIFCLLGGDVNIYTVHEAIDVALAVRQPRVAWEIRIWGNGLKLFDQQKVSGLWVDKEQEEQVYEWKSGPQFIARALLGLHRRGFMEESELRTKLDSLGVGWMFLNGVAETDKGKAPHSSPVV